LAKPKRSLAASSPLDDLITKVNKKYGKDTGSKGNLQRPLHSIPTGILDLDLALGTGGWGRGFCHGVYGPRDIGKTNIIGLNAIREAQQMGLTAALIAYEPGFDPEWAVKHGVDIDKLLIVRPTTGEEAFALLYDLVSSGVVDITVFDSIGSILSEGEIDEDGKMKVGGQAGLITWGVKRVAPIAYRNESTILFLNQIRDNMGSRQPGAVQQPGGHALEHMEASIVRLRPGKGRYTLKINGDDVLIGREIIAVVERNKLSQGSNKKASFDFYQMETEEYPFGIDRNRDIINTAKRTGVIRQRGSMYDLPDGTTHKGFDKVSDHIEANPEVIGVIRDGVMRAMIENNTTTVLEAVE
jgi:recombination protein RecA